MASSYANQIPVVLYVMQKLMPKRILDIGKGFGKYGFLIHEYVGIDYTTKPNPAVSLANQSTIRIDAVDINEDYSFPHLDQMYDKVIIRNVLDDYSDLNQYDVILMCDVIEHLEKGRAIGLLKHFIGLGATMVIATPRDFFEQELFESEAENHVSHWTVRDFKQIGYVDSQAAGPGVVYVVSAKPVSIVGFGNRPVQKLKRTARFLLDEFGGGR